MAAPYIGLCGGDTGKAFCGRQAILLPSCGGAPISIIGQYIERQRNPQSDSYRRQHASAPISGVNPGACCAEILGHGRRPPRVFVLAFSHSSPRGKQDTLQSFANDRTSKAPCRRNGWPEWTAARPDGLQRSSVPTTATFGFAFSPGLRKSW